jgi:hypothetical protein
MFLIHADTPPIDLPQLKYTVRPWVRAGPAFAIPVMSASGFPTPMMTDRTDSRLSTIRLVEPTCGTQFCQRMDRSRLSSASSTRDTPTPTHTLESSRPSSFSDTQERRTSRSALFGPRDKTLPSPKSSLTSRARGMTVPIVSSSPSTPERRSERALSITPSTSSKHIVNWFSGLLGR